ncbi:MAG TPA: hypothetical protein VGM37_12655 [Armatimonadota bacterium]|jgi:hypothetical protein
MDSLEREAQERKKKAIALASLPLCLGFFVWRLQSTTKAAPPPKAPPLPVVAKAAPAVAAALGPIATLQKTRIVSVPVGDRDPFAAAFRLTIPAAKPPMSVKPITTGIRPGSFMGAPLPVLRPFGTPQPPSVQPNPSPTLSPAGPAEPAIPVMPFTLTGVVKGFPDVAILRHVDGTRRIARVGDRLDNRYRLASIGENSVVLEGGDGLTTLQLGGDLPVPPSLDKK